MRRTVWWRPGHGRAGRCVAWSLALLMAFQTSGCAGGRLIPQAHVSMVSPWRYYDLWQALRLGRGVIVGTTMGKTTAGKFITGGPQSIEIHATDGYTSVPVSEVRYLINVLDLSRAREGTIAGGLIGLGTGLSLAYMTGGRRVASSATSRIVAARQADDSESSSGTGDSQSTDSESSAGTTPSASNTEAGQSSVSDAGANADAAGGSSGGSSTSNDPTQTGSNTYSEDQRSSGGSSSGGAADGTTTQGSSSGSNTAMFIEVNDQGGSSGGSSSGGRYDNGQPASSGGPTTAWRTVFFAVSFTAIGSFIGWMVGRHMRRQVPRVDYVLFPKNLDNRSDRSPDQYLADQITTISPEHAVELLPPGSQFDSPQSATQFDQLAHQGEVVRLGGLVGGAITRDDARMYRLFPTVDNLMQATILRCGDGAEREGRENRYLAMVVRKVGGVPTVSLQRLMPRDVIRLSTQITLVQAGILTP